MPQTSIAYACGRIGVLKRAAIRSAQIERLLSATSYDDACRTLSDIGFETTDSMDFQAAADHHVRKACDLIKAVTPDERVTDSFLLRYDILNLKVLLKSRHLAQKPEFLSACGTLKVDVLKHCVAERTYEPLPVELKLGMQTLEKKMAVHFDPSLVDTELDKAMYRQIFENLKNAHVKLALQYFQTKVDFANFIMLERCKAMGKDAAFYAQIALEGGAIPVRTFERAFEDQDQLTKLLKRYGVSVYQAALSAAMNSQKLPYMEKVADDYAYGLFKPHQYDAASMEMLIAYLLRRQREAADVRLIMAGKLNGFKSEAMAERLRELNG